MFDLEIIALQLEEEQIYGTEDKPLLAEDIQPILEILYERGVDFSDLSGKEDYQENNSDQDQDQQAIGKTSD
jgi:hypothetical protein